MNHRFFSWILLAAFWTVPAFAQEPIDLDLSKAVGMAIVESEAAQIKGNEIKRRELQRREARSTVYPNFSARVGYNYYPSVQKISVALDPTQPPQNVSLMQDFEFDGSVTWNQTLYTFGKVRNAIRAAKHAREAARYDQNATERDVAYETALSYFSVLLAEKTLKVAKESHANAVANRTLLEKRFTYGRVPKADNIKIAADIAIRVPSLRESESSIVLAAENLKMLTGIQSEVPLRLTNDLRRTFPTYDLKRALETMLVSDPALRALSKTVALNQSVAKLQKAQHYPTIEGMASYHLYAQGNEYYIDEKFQHLGTLGLMLKIPIWEGGRKGSIYQQAKLDAANAQLQLRAVQKRYSLVLRKAIADYRTQVAIYKANLEAQRLSGESFKALQEQYASGKLAVTALNDAELQLTNSKLRTLLNLHQINQLMADIERHLASPGDLTWIAKLIG